jgi:hypothetical protein
MFSSGRADLTGTSKNLTPLIQTGLPYDDGQNVTRGHDSSLYSTQDSEGCTAEGDPKSSPYWDAYPFRWNNIPSKSSDYEDSDSETCQYTTKPPASRNTAQALLINTPRLFSSQTAYAIDCVKISDHQSPDRVESNSCHQCHVKLQGSDIKESPTIEMPIRSDVMKAHVSKDMVKSDMEEIKPFVHGDTTTLVCQLAGLSISPANSPNSAEIASELEEECRARAHDAINLSRPSMKSESFVLVQHADVSNTETIPLSPRGHLEKNVQGGEVDMRGPKSSTCKAETSSPPSSFSASDEHWAKVFHTAEKDQVVVEKNGSIVEEVSEETVNTRSMLKRFGDAFSSQVLSEFLSIVNFVGCASSPGEVSSASSGFVNYGATSSSRKSRGYGRTANDIDDLDAEDDDDEGSDVNRDSGHTEEDSNSTDKTYVCPFYRRNRDLYRDENTCARTRWQCVARIK